MKMIASAIDSIRPVDIGLMQQAQRRLDNLTKPRGSLGRLEELAKQIVGITGKQSPALANKVIFTFAADHGATAEKVSPYPQEVTAQMVANFLRGGAGINVLARHIGGRVVVADLGVATDLAGHPDLVVRKINYGTANIAHGPAMSNEEAARSIEAGMDIFAAESAKGIDIAGIGEMGIGNTTAASAITAVITRRPVEKVTGRGAGVDDAGLAHKIKVIKEALQVNHPDAADPLDVLAKVGGFEIGGLAGVLLAAAGKRVPVVIDGFIAGAAALLACALEPKVKQYLIASHCSAEKGGKAILEYLGFIPLLDLGLRLGEGTGAALGIGLADAAVKILTQMATFESAQVSEKVKQ